jgi:2-C-methyl-D-erythritol 4-phosphate cytidylyltransferase / 2-C-methyl-D-erythritol 2,4-cyclodiphosphate synthase
VNERIAAVIVAAGQSTRFGGPKILTTIADVPVIIRTLRSIRAVPGWQSIVLVVNPEIRDSVRDLVDREPGNREITIIEGGALRQDSVWAGIEAVGNVDIVVIHDGARPLVSPHLIESTIMAVRDGADAAIAAVLVTDTLKRKSGKAIETIDRTDLWRSQTPQAFRMTTLRTSLAEARRRDLTLTDESMAIERTGGQVILVPGDEKNLKLTNPGDAHLMEAILHGDRKRVSTAPRTGIGYDVHRLVPGRRLMLGGLEIPFDHGLDGHSDADVLLHAIADAILGACAQGDIGRHFPPSDAAYRDISSLVLLERVNEIVAAQGFRVVNIDATIIAEAPQIGPYAEQMQKMIGAALGVEFSAVSVKATTNEGLGFAGRREGIAAMAIATVQPAI